MGCGGSKKPNHHNNDQAELKETKVEHKNEETKTDIGKETAKKPEKHEESKKETSENHKKESGAIAPEEGQAGGHAGTLLFEGDRLLKKAKKGEINFFEWLYSPDQS